MALVVKDRVQQTSTTTSTGTYVLSGSVTGYQNFSVIGDGNTTYYAATNGTDWEVGIGTYTLSGTTLSRDTILASSNSNNAVNWGAGVKSIFVTYPADKSIYQDASGNTFVPNLGATTASSAAVTTLSASGVASFSAGSASAPAIVRATDTNTGVYWPAVDNIALATGGVMRVQVDASGNVGIGLVDPNYKLTVAGNQPILRVFANTGNLNSIIYLSTSGDNTNTHSIEALCDNESSYANLNISTLATIFKIQGTESARINSSGNFGLGTSTPTNILSLGGNSARTFWMERHTTANTAGNNLTVQSGGATSGATDKNGGNLILSSATSTGTGTSQIIFNTATAGSTGTADNAPAERMRITGAGNVGIGTNAPGQKLDVYGAGAVFADIWSSETNAAGIRLGISATANRANVSYTSSGLQLATTVATPILFQTNGTEKMRLDSSGNLGIGTNAPTNILSLGGNSARTFWMERHTTANTAGNNLTVQSGGATSGATDKNGGNLILSSATSTGTGTSQIIFNTATAGTTGTTDRTPTEKMRIDGAGNVGIGTASPGEKLHVIGAITTGGQAAANKTSAGTFDFYAADNATRILSWGSTGVGGSISFWTGSGGSGTTEKMRIDSSGNVGIGRVPTYSLDVNSTARFNTTIGVGNTAPSASGAGISFPATQSASTDANTLDDYEENTWTPTDGSGAGLSFTDVTARYTKIGNVVTVFAKLTYPTTASGVQAKIDGLPFAATNGGQLMYCSSSTTTTGFGQGYIVAGTTTATLVTQTSATRANSQLSTLVLYFSGTYLT